jgi:hypothetical protein
VTERSRPVERERHTLVCDHAITLATTPRAIATSWWVADKTYGGGAPTHWDFKV